MKLNSDLIFRIINEELQKVVERAYAYGTFSMPSGQPSSPCPQGSKQIGFLEKVDEEGKPLPRCVANDDGREINLEDFQQQVKSQHSKMKAKLLKKGGNKTKAAPYDVDPSMKRSKSAPPGFGGS